MNLMSLMTGGFLKGQRTYVLGLLLAAQAVVAWLVGDSSLAELFTKVPEILTGLGIMTLRAGMK